MMDVQLTVSISYEFEKQNPSGTPCYLCNNNIYSHDNILIWVMESDKRKVKKETNEVYCDSCIMEIIKTK